MARSGGGFMFHSSLFTSWQTKGVSPSRVSLLCILGIVSPASSPPQNQPVIVTFSICPEGISGVLFRRYCPVLLGSYSALSAVVEPEAVPRNNMLHERQPK